MDSVLGLLMLAFYIAVVIGLAALVTWAVIKLFPTEKTPKQPKDPDAASAES